MQVAIHGIHGHVAQGADKLWAGFIWGAHLHGILQACGGRGAGFTDPYTSSEDDGSVNLFVDFIFKTVQMQEQSAICMYMYMWL